MTQRIRTGIIIALVFLAFFIPSIWVPILPVFLFLALTYFSSLEKVMAIRTRLDNTSKLPMTVTSLVLVIFPFLAMPKSWIFTGAPKAELKFYNNMTSGMACNIFLYALIGLVAVSFFWIIVRVLKADIEILPIAIADVFVMSSNFLPLAALISLLYGFVNGPVFVFIALLTAFITDIFAYFVGVFFGKTPFFRHVSPKKTWEGTIGGMVIACIFNVCVFIFWLGPLWGFNIVSAIFAGLFFGIVLSSVSVLGDLKASALKRWCHIKDFSNLLPGHGGITDRLDSLSISLVAMLFLLIIFSGFGY